MESRRVQPWLGALVGALLLALAVVLLLDLLPETASTVVSYVAQTVTVVAACAAMLHRARRGSPALRRARVLVAAAMVSAAAGGVLATALAVVHGRAPAGLSIEDVAHFGFLPLAVAGLLSYPVSAVHPGSAARSLLDGLMAAAAGWFVVYALVLDPSGVGEGRPSADAAVALAYPAADVLVLAMCASVLTRVTARAHRELAVICAGLALYCASDVAYSALESRGTYEAGSWVGLLAEAGLLLLVVGAVQAGTATPVGPRTRRAYALLPFLPVLAALAVAASVALRGEQLGRPQAAVAVVIVLLLLLRQAVGSRDRLDMTERLREREELFRSLVTGSADLIVLHGLDGVIRYVSPAVLRTTGLSEDAVDGTSLERAVHPEDRPALLAAERAVRAEPGAHVELAVRLLDPSGEHRWHLTHLRNATHEPAVRGIVTNARDVHERRLLELEVSHAATHDALTGLGNLARARELLAEVCSADQPSTVVLVDLDGFKSVNDTFGHAAGDALLCEVAARLATCVRSRDTVTRIGGDEFLLVLPGEPDGTEVAERVLAALRPPVLVAGRPLITGASAGLAGTELAASPEELLRNADLAMYAAKAAGRGRATGYEPGMHDSAARRMQVQRGLRRALDEGHLSLVYQPIVRLPHGRTTGLEALLRWRDPELGALGPDAFIPVAEECGMMPEVDAWVLRRACQDLVSWGAAAVPVSVNVSRSHLTPELPGLVAAVLADYGVPGHLLVLEITESAVVPDPEQAITVLQEIRATGVRVALDDFGTGHSSLSQLARLPVDTVKIDKSFVLASAQDPGARRLLTSIIGVCASLGLPVVAEGIEDASLVESLDAEGCAYGQGWHFGRPVPAAAVPALLGRAVPAPRPASDPRRAASARR